MSYTDHDILIAILVTGGVMVGLMILNLIMQVTNFVRIFKIEQNISNKISRFEGDATNTEILKVLRERKENQ